MNEFETKKELEKRLKELEEVAKERYMSKIDSWAEFMLNYLTSEEYEEWIDIIDKLDENF